MHANDDRRANDLEGASYRELRLLETVESTPEVSQRRLAHQLGVALGVANLLVRSLAKKGYIRASRVAWKRWIYVLTPAGIARKVQLSLGYVERFLDHYRRVRALLREDLGSLTMNAESNVAIYGTTELAELMYLALRDMGVTNIDFYDHTDENRSFLGMPVKNVDLIDPNDYVKVLVAHPADVEASCRRLHSIGVSPSQVVTLLQNSQVEAILARQQDIAEEE